MWVCDIKLKIMPRAGMPHGRSNLPRADASKSGLLSKEFCTNQILFKAFLFLCVTNRENVVLPRRFSLLFLCVLCFPLPMRFCFCPPLCSFVSSVVTVLTLIFSAPPRCNWFSVSPCRSLPSSVAKGGGFYLRLRLTMPMRQLRCVCPTNLPRNVAPRSTHKIKR